jgi:shikimate dehydrogenase
MQNAAIKANGLNAVYVPFHVTPMQLCDAVSGIRALSLLGINVTIPHKEKVCEFLDEVDGDASLIGAVNTIVNRNSKLIGYNTDSLGLLKVLQNELKTEVEGGRFILLGAGGACRATVVALAQSGAKWIGIANRSSDRSRSIIESLAPKFTGTTFAQFPLSEELLRQCLYYADVLINTTAVGLNGEGFDFDVSRCVKKNGAVFDMVYGHKPTLLIKEAARVGLQTANGLGMLVGQGEAAFEIWFGSPPQPKAMRNAIQKFLKAG